MATGNTQPMFSRTKLDAVIFDLDGVVTDTASIHAAAWKATFDEFLQRRSEASGEPFVAFTQVDYRRYVDGRPRYAGVRSFLRSRGIELREGTPQDPPQEESVYGLGKRKNERFLEQLHREPPPVFAGSVRLIRALRACGYHTAVVTSSRNGAEILRSAGLESLFDVRVDGLEVARLGLRGKPAPDAFLHAARLLHVAPRRCAVIEDALAGVEAGRAGGFGLVLGLARSGKPGAYRDHGADGVFANLAEVSVAEMDYRPRWAAELPSALDALPEILHTAQGGLLLLLDYDGTLTPIVDRPELAVLSPGMRTTLRELAAVVPVAVVSGRDLKVLRQLVAVPDLVYVGDHGFDTSDSIRESHPLEAAGDYLPVLDAIEQRLRRELAGIDGFLLERKRFSIAVHFRLVAEADVPQVQARIREVLSEHPQLKATPGKKVVEIQPGIDWDKGRAVEWLLPQLDASGRRHPVYIGDDVTDEDAFRVLRDRGTGILVRDDEEYPTAAHYALDDSREVRLFLQRLTRSLKEADR